MPIPILSKWHCRLAGHPVPGELGKFLPPMREPGPAGDLPYLDARCPRCATPLRLPFLPYARGTDTPVHAAAIARWQQRIRAGGDIAAVRAVSIGFGPPVGAPGFDRVWAVAVTLTRGECLMLQPDPPLTRVAAEALAAKIRDARIEGRQD